MKKQTVLALLLALALCLTGLALAEAQESATEIEDFTWTACDGTACTLSEVLGEKELVLIALFETPEGADELLLLQEAWADMQDRVAVFAMAVDADMTDEALAALAGEKGLTLPLGLDSAGIRELTQPEALPAFVAVAAEGKVASIQSGALLSVNAYQAMLESMLGGGEAEEAATPVPPAPLGMSNYTLRYVDQNGDPVEGLIANICDDSACMPMFTNDQGKIFFQYPSFAYHIQVIRVPEGYEYDLTEESYLDADGGSYTFVVTKN